MAASAGSAQQDVRAVPLSGPVILTVTGLDSAQFPDGRQEFDMARLQSLGERQIKTSTMWTKGANLYNGVMLRSLIDHLKLAGGNLKLNALNDYAIVISVDEATAEAPMLAYMVNWTPMTVREKGPIWVIYPFDSDEKFRTDEIYARSVWQLASIEVLR